MLWTAALWALLPLAAFVLTGVIYLGSALFFADAALRGGRADFLRALRLAVRRAGSGLVVLLAIVIGVLPLGYFAVRWAFALPEVWLRGASPRAALRSSWQSTRGRVARLYLVLGGTQLAVVALGVGMPLLAGMLPWEHGAIVAQALCGMLLSPIPVLVLVQRWRDAGGTAHPDTLTALRAEAEDVVRPVPGRGALAGATSLTLVVGLLLPVGAASADTFEEGGAAAPAPAPAPTFAAASAVPVVQVTPEVSVTLQHDPPYLGDPVDLAVNVDPDGLIPADIVVDAAFEVVNALDGTVLATGSFRSEHRVGAASFPLRAWAVSIVVRSVVETADARYEIESAPVAVAAARQVTLYPTIDKVSERTRYAGAVAGAALALYSAEVYKFDFTQTGAKDLRDTAAFLACLGNTYG